MRKTLLAALLVGLTMQATLANDIWDESVDGDLSGSFAAPQVLSLSVGPNTVSGDIGDNGNTGASNGRDADYITFTLSPGQSLTSITLDSYTNVGGAQSFIGYVDAPAFTGQGTGDLASGTAFELFGFADLASPNLLSPITSVVGPLGPGDHSFWIQETAAGPVTYSFTFTVIPEPSSVALIGLASVAIVAWRRVG